MNGKDWVSKEEDKDILIQKLRSENAELRKKLVKKDLTRISEFNMEWKARWVIEGYKKGSAEWKTRWKMLKCYIYLNVVMPKKEYELIRKKMQELESGGEVLETVSGDGTDRHISSHTEGSDKSPMLHSKTPKPEKGKVKKNAKM